MLAAACRGEQGAESEWSLECTEADLWTGSWLRVTLCACVACEVCVRCACGAVSSHVHMAVR